MQPILLVLAAGIGSRYGGLKQVDGMGPGGEAILEFSVFDALRAGFGKVVFVIRQDIEEAFREHVGSRVEPYAQVEYAFQEMDTALSWLHAIPKREKPWGTGHALLSARQHLTAPFVTINADDFYGPQAFEIMGKFLREECSPSRSGMVAYQLGNTLSENGTVSRGVCRVNQEGFLDEVVETHKIERIENAGISYPTPDGSRCPLSADTPVSMTFWGFHPALLPEFEAQFRQFVEANDKQPKAEFYIPSVVDNLLKTKKIDLKVMHTNSQWYGVTYPQDKAGVQVALSRLVEVGTYPQPLWK